MPPQQRANSDCGIEINTLPKLPGVPDEDEYFLTVNAIEGYYGYALREWSSIRDYIDETVDIEEDDPVFKASPAFTIKNSDIDKWNAALQIESDPVFLASPAAGIESGDIDRWNTSALNGIGIVEMAGTTATYLASTGTGKVVKENSPVFQSNITVPLIYGGSETTSTLTLQSTSGAAATGSDIIFKSGSTEIVRMLANGKVGIGTTTPGSATLHVFNPTTSAFLFITGKGDASQYANVGIIGSQAANGAAYFTLRVTNPAAGIMTSHNQSSYYYSLIFRLNGTGTLISDSNVTGGEVISDVSAQFEVRSSQRGILIPRVTTTQMNNMTPTAANGLMVWVTNGIVGLWNYITGIGWQKVGGVGSGTVESVTGTVNRITSSGGVNPVIDIAATYAGQSTITTVGTITQGVWNGTAIGDFWISSANTWNAKQDALVSGTTIKTINGTSVLGPGNILLDFQATLDAGSALNKTNTVDLSTNNFVFTNGKVGIGTTPSASSILQVNGDVAATSLTGILRTVSTSNQAIFATSNGSGGMLMTLSSAQIGGGGTNVKIVSRHNSSSSPSANESNAHFIIGTNNVNINASGAHPIFTQLAVKPLSMTTGAGTVTATATLYLEDAATAVVGAPLNYNLWAAGTGINRIDGNTLVGSSASITVPSAKLQIVSTTTQLRLNYDDNNYLIFTVASNGNVTYNTAGAANTNTFNGQVIAAGFQSSGVNFLTASQAGGNTVSLANASMLGQANMMYRVMFRGSSAAGPNANYNYVSTMIATHDVNSNSAGTYPLYAQLAIKPLNITTGAGAITNAATVYIEGPSIGTATPANSYAVWVDAGIVRIDGTINNAGAANYADNAAAIAGGLRVGDYYHTSGTLKVVI